MDRAKLVNRYFQKNNLLVVSNKLYARYITDIFNWMVKADSLKNDVTAKNLLLNKMGKAVVVSKQDGIIAGIEEVVFLLRQQTNLTVVANDFDGKLVSKGDILLTLQGSNQDLLAYERTILNIIGRMSGIATFTSRQVHALEKMAHPPFVAATRKTPWMLLDKKAVAMGGGLTHRLSLSDFPLVKDNYLQAVRKEQNIKFEEAIERAVLSFSSSFFEIEVRNTLEWQAVQKSLELALREEDIIVAIMLDNFNIKSAVELIKEIKKSSIFRHLIIEVSGEITQENLLSWAKTGADIVSMGALTHSAPTFNVSMRMV